VHVNGPPRDRTPVAPHGLGESAVAVAPAPTAAASAMTARTATNG
jgi:hypothetical protein